MLAETAARDTAEPSKDISVPVERRSGERQRTVFWIARVTRDDDVGLWRVHNVSDRGMMLQSQVEVTPGERLSVDISDGCAVAGTVRWYKDDRCGIEFEQPIDCDSLLSTLATERREHRFRPPRLSLSRGATAYCERGLQPVRVCNISQHGIGLEHEGRIRPGMRLKLVLENGLERRGLVRWSKDGHSGLQLSDPFSSNALVSRNRF